eukprot:218326-Prymnesium_polylepis.3
MPNVKKVGGTRWPVCFTRSTRWNSDVRAGYSRSIGCPLSPPSTWWKQQDKRRSKHATARGDQGFRA